MHRPLNIAPHRHPCRFGHSNRNEPTTVLSPFPLTSINDAPFCRFCLASHHSITQCPAILRQFHTKLIHSWETNLSPIMRCPQLYPPSTYHAWLPQKFGSTTAIQRFEIAPNMLRPHQQRNFPPIAYVVKASATPPPSKKQKRKTRKQCLSFHLTVHPMQLSQSSCRVTRE